MRRKDTIQVVCVAEFWAFQGKAEELIEALHVLMKPTHAEEGCIRYELNQRADDERGITFIEKWKNKEAFDQHCATSYIAHYFNDVMPHLVERYEVKLYHEILP
jgi:quinol monooxygenase YgiN